MKKRVLWVNEACFLSTGFATLSLEILKRLHATGKYDIMEYASYSPPNDARARGLPWRHKSAMPTTEAEKQHYHSNPINQFGEWKFEEACLEFHPDIVCSTRDHWMDAYIERSPFRPFYHWVHMPTVDAEPQCEQWLSTYMNADAVFTYSDWALNLLRKEAGRQINLLGSAPPGADLETYQVPADKQQHKQAMGLDPDSLIVGTVMRNQRRKLYPELIQAFALFLSKAPKELTDRTYLYLHTAWPDVGWDLPLLIKEAGLGSKILLTYFCRVCGAVFPSFFQDSRAHCRQCGAFEAFLPRSEHGVSRQVLSQIYGLFDVYVQYANSEGFGMPMAEAAACGVPVMATDYSAMSDVVRKLRGTPIRVLTLVREPETHCYRAIPDPDDFLAQLQPLLLLPAPVRSRMSRKIRQAVEQHYSWDQTARKWEDHLDSVAVKDHKTTWQSPSRAQAPETQIPEGLMPNDFVRWGLARVARQPQLAHSYLALRLTRDLNLGFTTSTPQAYLAEESGASHRKPQEFTQKHVMDIFLAMAEKFNVWETLRTRPR